MRPTADRNPCKRPSRTCTSSECVLWPTPQKGSQRPYCSQQIPAHQCVNRHATTTEVSSSHNKLSHLGLAGHRAEVDIPDDADSHDVEHAEVRWHPLEIYQVCCRPQRPVGQHGWREPAGREGGERWAHGACHSASNVASRGERRGACQPEEGLRLLSCHWRAVVLCGVPFLNFQPPDGATGISNGTLVQQGDCRV